MVLPIQLLDPWPFLKYVAIRIYSIQISHNEPYTISQFQFQLPWNQTTHWCNVSVLCVWPESNPLVQIPWHKLCHPETIGCGVKWKWCNVHNQNCQDARWKFQALTAQELITHHLIHCCQCTTLKAVESFRAVVDETLWARSERN